MNIKLLLQLKLTFIHLYAVLVFKLMQNPLQELKICINDWLMALGAWWRFVYKSSPRHIWTYSDIAAVGTIFNVLSYNAVLDRDSDQSPSRRRTDALRVEPGSLVMQKWYLAYIFLYTSLIILHKHELGNININALYLDKYRYQQI